MAYLIDSDWVIDLQHPDHRRSADSPRTRWHRRQLHRIYGTVSTWISVLMTKWKLPRCVERLELGGFEHDDDAAEVRILWVTHKTSLCSSPSIPGSALNSKARGSLPTVACCSRASWMSDWASAT